MRVWVPAALRIQSALRLALTRRLIKRHHYAVVVQSQWRRTMACRRVARLRSAIRTQVFALYAACPSLCVFHTPVRAWVGSSWRIIGARSWPRPSVVLCVPCSIGPTTLPPASISKRAATLCGGGSDGALLRRASLACVVVANCLGWCAAACVWSVMPPRPLLEHGQHGKRIACDAW